MTGRTLHITVGQHPGESACALLSRISGISKLKIKHAMQCGAVRHRRPSGRWKPIRRATTQVHKNDQLALYYDPDILNRKPPPARCITDFKDYSIWYKPAGMLTQGTRYGDHCALTRQAEQHFHPRRPIFVVHRIDREAAGLVMLAHSRKMAAALSEQFRSRRIKKTYQVTVRGKLGQNGAQGIIDTPLEGKPSQTAYRIDQYDPAHGTTRVTVSMASGRRHQIRRHFDGIGHPVMGDPHYGSGNAHSDGLQLVACTLAWTCPVDHVQRTACLDETLEK